MDMASASLATAPAFEEPASEESGKPHLRGCPVSFAKLKALLAADLYRYAGRTGFGAFAKHYAFTPGYKYTVLMRTAGWLKLKPAKAFGLYPFAKWLLLREIGRASCRERVCPYV